MNGTDNEQIKTIKKTKSGFSIWSLILKKDNKFRDIAQVLFSQLILLFLDEIFRKRSLFESTGVTIIKYTCSRINFLLFDRISNLCIFPYFGQFALYRTGKSLK